MCVLAFGRARKVPVSGLDMCRLQISIDDDDDGYLFIPQREPLSNERKGESTVFFSPLFFLFFFVWKDTRTDEKGKAQNDREKIL